MWLETRINLSVMRRIFRGTCLEIQIAQGQLNVRMRSQSDRCHDSETSLSDVVVVNPNLPSCSFVTCGSAIEESVGDVAVRRG